MVTGLTQIAIQKVSWPTYAKAQQISSPSVTKVAKFYSQEASLAPEGIRKQQKGL